MLFKKIIKTPKILLVQGSLSPYSKTAILIDHAARALRTRSIPYDILDLCTANLDFYREGEDVTYGKSTQNAVARISNVDGLLFATPVYGGSVSGGVKNLMDIAYKELNGKSVGLCCHSAEGNSYHASVAFKELLMRCAHITTVQPILHTQDDSFKNKAIYDDAVCDILEEMIDSLFLQLEKRAMQH